MFTGGILARGRRRSGVRPRGPAAAISAAGPGAGCPSSSWLRDRAASAARRRPRRAPSPRSGGWAGRRRRFPAAGALRLSRSRRRMSQAAPAVRPPRRRIARPSSMSSVTTRIAVPAAWAASAVPPVPIASATSRSIRLSAEYRPLWRTVSPDAIRVPRSPGRAARRRRARSGRPAGSRPGGGRSASPLGPARRRAARWRGAGSTRRRSGARCRRGGPCGRLGRAG